MSPTPAGRDGDIARYLLAEKKETERRETKRGTLESHLNAGGERGPSKKAPWGPA